jgi:hypothetical protein
VFLAASPYRLALKIGALRKNGGGSGILQAPPPSTCRLAPHQRHSLLVFFGRPDPATGRTINGAFENEPRLRVKVRKSTEDVSEDFGKLPTMTG